MPLEHVKRLSQKKEEIKRYRVFKYIRHFLKDPSIFHYNRKTVGRGMAIGLFVAFLPIPMQMLVVAILAIYFKGNLPLALALVWISNPITMPVIFYFTYEVGRLVMELPAEAIVPFSLDIDFLLSKNLWKPLMLGGLLVGSVASIIGYIFVEITWRINILNYLRNKGKFK